MKKLNIFHYTNFRLFVKDVLNVQKITSRAIALRSNIDPSLFAKILKAKRNILFDDSFSLATVIGLNKKEFERFDLLIRFCQTDSKNEKKFLSKKVKGKND
jgi:hypothetical protein